MCSANEDLPQCRGLADLYGNRGKAIAIRLAEDGFDVCINDVEANQAGIDEVCFGFHQFLSKCSLASSISYPYDHDVGPNADDSTS